MVGRTMIGEKFYQITLGGGLSLFHNDAWVFGGAYIAAGCEAGLCWQGKTHVRGFLRISHGAVSLRQRPNYLS
jgi:hypothetical protein